MQKLFNSRLKHGMTPDAWRKTIIHPIPKDNVKLIDPLQYRGIALQSCICKILSNIVNSRIIELVECNDIFDIL